jgi:hypothetical protein
MPYIIMAKCHHLFNLLILKSLSPILGNSEFVELLDAADYKTLRSNRFADVVFEYHSVLLRGARAFAQHPMRDVVQPIGRLRSGSARPLHPDRRRLESSSPTRSLDTNVPPRTSSGCCHRQMIETDART